jgi:DNA-binding transcriptional LysR family regulator
MDIQKIETFICAAENLTFSEAARLLNLSQPTVSHQINALEKELGVTLFDRSSTGLKLTEAGRLLLPWARRLIHDTNDLKDMMDSLRDDIAGEIRIACSTTAGKYILPQMANRFRQRYPGIRIRILACGAERATLNLMEGEADLGVVSSEVIASGLEAQPFFQDSIILIAPADHAWANRAYIEPHEILEQPFLQREPHSGTYRVVKEELAKFDIKDVDLNCVMELGNSEAIVHTVASGHGISFVSALAAACPLEQGKIVEVPVKGLELQRTVYMIRRRIGAPNRPRDAFWSFIHVSDNEDLLFMPKQVTAT